MDVEQIQKMMNQMKNDILVAMDEKLDKKLENTLDKLTSKVNKHETDFIELQEGQKDNLKKLDDLTARVDLDNETLVDNTESLDKLDRDYKLMELRATETEA